MKKAKSILVLILSITLTSLTVLEAYARQLTPTERNDYAQNNIIFYVPGEPENTEESPSSSGDPDTVSGNPDTVSGEGAELIVNFAIKSSWPNESGKCYDGSSYTDWKLLNRNTSPEGCKSTINAFAKSHGGSVERLTDCGRFVGFVLRNTVDPKAKYGGTYSQSDHFDSDTTKWAKVSTDGQAFPTNKLQPGDILVYGDRNGDSNAGHILIYIGERTVPCGNSTCSVNTAEASIGGSTPRLYKLWNGTYMYRNQQYPYSVYRYIGNSSSSSTSSTVSTETVTTSDSKEIDISKDIFKPCPSTVKTKTKTAKYYSYTYNGTSYHVANTAIDLNSYINYLKTRHIAQDGKTCDPVTNNCSSDSGYDDSSKTLYFARAITGNLQTGNCTSTDYGFASGIGSINSSNPQIIKEKGDSGRLKALQLIYDAIITSGKTVLVKTSGGNHRSFATAVGIKTSAKRASLKDSDILYLNTTGTLSNTNKLYYDSSNGSGWWIIIPIEET